MVVKKELGEDSDEIEIDADSSLGISFIASIASKISSISSAEQVVSAILQIFVFFKSLPKAWQKKAFQIINTLWMRKVVIISTDPEEPQKVYEPPFDDGRLTKLYNVLPESDKSIILLGNSMTNLISRGLHKASDDTKMDVDEEHGKRGLTIVNMMTTGDLQYVLVEIEGVTDSKKILEIFNNWVTNYERVALLISPLDLDDLNKVECRILALSENTKQSYLLIHISGELFEINKLPIFINKLKDEKKLNFKEIECNIHDSGFYKALDVKIVF